jgi:hypothetical protein
MVSDQPYRAPPPEADPYAAAWARIGRANTWTGVLLLIDFAATGCLFVVRPENPAILLGWMGSVAFLALAIVVGLDRHECPHCGRSYTSGRRGGLVPGRCASCGIRWGTPKADAGLIMTANGPVAKVIGERTSDDIQRADREAHRR